MPEFEPTEIDVTDEDMNSSLHDSVVEFSLEEYNRLSNEDYNPEIINEYIDNLEEQGESALSELSTKIFETTNDIKLDIDVVNRVMKGISKKLKTIDLSEIPGTLSGLDKIENDIELTQTESDAINSQTEKIIQTLKDYYRDELRTDEERNAFDSAANTASKTVETLNDRLENGETSPDKSGIAKKFFNVLKNIFKFLIKIAPFLGAFALLLYAAHLLTGCYQMLESDANKLTCGNYYNKKENRGDCTCISSSENQNIYNCYKSNNRTCADTRQTECDNQKTKNINEGIGKRPVCRIQYGECGNATPFVCTSDLKVYYGYKYFNALTVIPEIFKNWENLFEKGGDGLKKLLFYILFVFGIILLIAIFYYFIRYFIRKSSEKQVQKNKKNKKKRT